MHLRPIRPIRPIGLMLFIAACMAAPKLAHAQSASLAITPPVVEILLAPNKKVTQTFSIKNQGEKVNLEVEIHAVVPNDSYGHVTVDPKPVDPTKIPLVITTSPAQNTPLPVAAGAALPVTITLEGVNLEAPTDIYLALVVKALPPYTPSSVQPPTTSLPGISSLILTTLTPTGTMPVTLELQGFDTPLIHDSFLPLPVSASLKNTAPVMVRPEGKFTVVSPRGATVAATPLYPNLILSASERIIQADCGGGNSRESVPCALSWQPKWYDFGPYRLRLTVTTLGGTKLSETEKTVWILPIRATVAFFLLAVITVTLLIRLRKPNPPKSDTNL